MSRTFDYQLQFVGLVEGRDEYGFPDTVEGTKDPILANKISVRSNEHYQAKNAGVEVKYAFEVHSFEYEGEEKAIYNEKEYKVERTYDKGDLTEVYLSRRADDHAS